MVATFLAAIATFCVLLAIYAATTVKDPMAKRVRALNERREQLKAGIVASTSRRRKSITNKNEVADKVRSFLGSLKMVQDEQVEKAQRRLMQAGIRLKIRFVFIFARLSCRVLGTGIVASARHRCSRNGRVQRYGLVASVLIGV